MTRALRLERLSDDGYATRGQLVDEEERFICYTLELPWRGNEPGVSCIPPGSYTAKRRWSEKHHRAVFGIEGVPNRADIEIHAANWPRQLLGCVAVGSSFGTVCDANGEHCAPGILKSGDALDDFMDELAGVDALPIVVTCAPEHEAADA